MKGLVEPKYYTRKQVKVHRAMSNTELLSETVVPSDIQFEKGGFTFLDSTEHLMPKIETVLEPSKPLLRGTK